MNQIVEWHERPRREFVDKRIPLENVDSQIQRENLAFGINLYHNAISKERSFEIISQLESVLNDPNIKFNWSGALINDELRENSVRNCYDFKMHERIIENNIDAGADILGAIYKDINDAVNKCLTDYGFLWNLYLDYKEAFNFVKYGAGEYFKIHVDHGPFNCYTVSVVVYLNDEYEGGEIEWNRLGVKLRPPAGSIAVFPSNYIYEHESHKILDGIKYSVVIMTDYNDLNHQVSEGNQYA